MMGPYCLMDWRDSSVVGQMTLAMTSCFLRDSLSFRSYWMSVQSAAVVHILCIDDVIVGFSRHVRQRQQYAYFPYKRCFKLR